MIRINLLPHRAAFRQQQVVEYIIVFVSAILLTIGLSFFVDVVTTQELESLQAERGGLEASNKKLRKKIGELRNLDSLRQDVEGKLQIVDELQAGRFRSLETLVGIADFLPENVWLTELNDKNGEIQIKGYGESSQAVANFMRTLGRSELFNKVQLMVDKSATVEGASVRSFSLAFHRLTLAEREQEKKIKVGGEQL